MKTPKIVFVQKATGNIFLKFVDLNFDLAQYCRQAIKRFLKFFHHVLFNLPKNLLCLCKILFFYWKTFLSKSCHTQTISIQIKSHWCSNSTSTGTFWVVFMKIIWSNVFWVVFMEIIWSNIFWVFKKQYFDPLYLHNSAYFFLIQHIRYDILQQNVFKQVVNWEL